MTGLRIALAAEESAGLQTLLALAQAGHSIVALFTSDPNSAIGRAAAGRDLELLPAKAVKKAATAQRLRDLEVDVLFNVHSLYIVCPEVLTAPRLGAFNLHPGPLPEYAGLNCISWAIYEGASEYGVTLHEMVPTLDAGDTIFQSWHRSAARCEDCTQTKNRDRRTAL